MTRKMLLTAAMLLAATYTYAQAPAPAAPGNRPPRAARADAPMPPDARGFDRPGPGDPMPPGTWWRNSDMVARVGLTPDQVKRIDDVFTQSRVRLIDLHATLEKEELLLEPLMDANPVDQNKAYAQIAKIADARAELEKTNAKMLLGIRAVLTPDQWTKLREMHHGFGRGDGRHDGPGRGPDGPGRPHGPAPPAE